MCNQLVILGYGGAVKVSRESMKATNDQERDLKGTVSTKGLLFI